MGPVKAAEWLHLSLAEPATIDCGRPLGALYLWLTLYLHSSGKGLLNNRDHVHLKQGLWEAYQLGVEGQTNSLLPPSTFSVSPPLPDLEPTVSSLLSPKYIWRLHSIKYLSAPAAP